MLSLYIWTGVLGMAMLLYSAIAGSHGADHSMDHDLSADAHDGSHADGAWTIFFSLRFWTFFAAFFGVTGILLTAGTPLGQVPTLALALAAGAIAGGSVGLTMRLLQRNEVNTNVSERDFVGQDAEVMVAMRPGQTGRIRLEAKGEMLDVLAVADDGTREILAGTKVVVVGYEDDRARVISRDEVYG